jgi:hypothetical protein
MRLTLGCVLLVAVLGTGCGGDEGEECNPTAATPEEIGCGEDTACNPESKTCMANCTLPEAEACAAGTTCHQVWKVCLGECAAGTTRNASGVCEASACLPSECAQGTYCSDAGTCNPVSELASCGRAQYADNTADAAGPTIWGWNLVDSGTGQSCPNLPGNPDPCSGGAGIEFTVKYYDPSGDFDNPANNDIFYVLGGSGPQPNTFAGCPPILEDVNGNGGTLRLFLCTPGGGSPPAPAVYVRDTAGNYSTVVCGPSW